jgi:hypothetical protein
VPLFSRLTIPASGFSSVDNKAFHRLGIQDVAEFGSA